MIFELFFPIEYKIVYFAKIYEFLIVSFVHLTIV